MNWQWNEFQQVGTDYEDESEVAAYDKRMRSMRDIDGENRRTIAMLQLDKDAVVLEIGAGTGALARAVAPLCRKVTAADVSPIMLQYAMNQAKKENLSNINFVHAGFLSLEIPEASVNAVVTGLALHHLPDTWKAVALRNIFRWLKPGGKFILFDVVFDWQDETPEHYFSRIVAAEDVSRPNLARHIAQEYSTLNWVMRGLIERAGFIIENEQCNNDFLCCYCCRKAIDGVKKSHE